MPNTPPIVTVNKFQTLLINDSISASSLFSVTDPDGDPIQRVRFFDFSDLGGYFELNGNPRANGSQVEIAYADLNKLFYVGGSPISNEYIRVQAYDGLAWSDASVQTRA